MADPLHLRAILSCGLLRTLSQGREHALASREYLTPATLRIMQEKYSSKGDLFASPNWYDDGWVRGLSAGEHAFLFVLTDIELPSLVSAIIYMCDVDLIHIPGTLPPELGCHTPSLLCKHNFYTRHRC